MSASLNVNDREANLGPSVSVPIRVNRDT
jgi:hypothetical protein